ncbi:MAG: sel1 repeat family protein [Cyanobacteria bacterium SZAS LIN-3]|nr:sel1 repeat family protein [Cyanobacteria bacterium SZAS LIN-3]
MTFLNRALPGLESLRRLSPQVVRLLVIQVFCILAITFLCFGLAARAAGGEEHADAKYLEQVHVHIKAHRYREAMTMLKVKAEKGCPYSQSLLGLMHQKGLGCKADARQAVQWFTMAAKHDFGDAQFQLGKLYKTAAGDLAPEAGEARYWLEKAAAQGIAEAREFFDRMPFGPQLEYKVAQFKNQAQLDAGRSEQGLEQSWTGYANIVNTLNASSHGPGNN